MQSMMKWVCAAGFFALLCSLCQAAHADKPRPTSPEAVLTALAEAGKPGTEHKKLEPLVGQWNFTMKIWTDPTLPPAEMTGTVDRKWIMGGRFVQETARGECTKTGKTFEGMSLLGYNAAEKQFTRAKACSLSGCLTGGPVSCDSTGKRFEAISDEVCPLSGQKVKSRDELVIESNDRIVFTCYKTIDGRELKFGEMVSVRKK